MAAYWCLNFDAVTGPMTYQHETLVLQHGLAHRMWLMQYQYSHGGHIFQASHRQLGSTTKNWKSAAGIAPGDKCIAYLRGNRFYAVGEAVKPRKVADRSDRVDRTVARHAHAHLEGIVKYTDAKGALYEDFTDEWHAKGHNWLCGSCQATCEAWQRASGIVFSAPSPPCAECRKYAATLCGGNADVGSCKCGAAAERRRLLPAYYRDHPAHLEVWKYPQRIDVEKWESLVPSGVTVSGLAEAAPFPKYRLAAFDIPEEFYVSVKEVLEWAARR